MKKSNKILLVFLVIFFLSLTSVSAVDNDAILTNDNQVVEDNPVELAIGDTDAILATDSVVEDNSVELTMGDSGAILANSQIIVSEGSSIQSAIDNAVAGSTIIVQNGTYSEDLVVPKGLSIVGQDAIIKANDYAFNILPTANNTSISGFNILVSNDDGFGIIVNASDCKITDNKISGGTIGIFSGISISIEEMDLHMINTISIIGNTISNCGESGISIKAFNPIISQNNVTNIANKKGNAQGIRVFAIGLFDEDLNVVVKDNQVSNVESSNNACGIDLWSFSILDSLGNFDVSGNTISDVVALHKAIGMTSVIASVKSELPSFTISDMNISDISSSGHENSSVTGLDVYVIGVEKEEVSDAIVRNVQINNLDASGANSKVTGITAVGVGCVELFVLNNNLSNFKSSKSAKGINTICIGSSEFRSFVSVSNNNVTNFDASKISGINVFSLGDAEINKNILYNLPSEDSTFITAITFRLDFGKVYAEIPEDVPADNLLGASMEDAIENIPFDKIIEFIKELAAKLLNSSIVIDGNLSMTGNNLEGTGIETGFKVLRPSTITYNRATNLKDNVVKESTRSFLLEAFGINPDVPSNELIYSLLKSEKILNKIPDEVIREISDFVGGALDKLFDDLDDVVAGDVDARYNWWGNNSMPSASKFKNNKGSVLYDPWLTLRVNSNPKVLSLGESSQITADVYIDSAGTDHSSDKFSFFSGPSVTLSTDKGSFDGEKSVTLDWAYGQASAYLKGDEIGLANVSAQDYDIAFTDVLIFGDNSTNSSNDSTPVNNVVNAKTLPVTGNPLALLFVLVILLGSVSGIKRK